MTFCFRVANYPVVYAWVQERICPERWFTSEIFFCRFQRPSLSHEHWRVCFK